MFTSKENTQTHPKNQAIQEYVQENVQKYHQSLFGTLIYMLVDISYVQLYRSARKEVQL